VIRTLFDRCNAVITEEEDKNKEKEHIKKVLNRCGYPDWSIKKVENKMKKGKTPRTKKQEQSKEKSKGLVVLPYVKGTSEQTQRLFRKYKVSTAFKPHTTMRQLMVHPKDKVEKNEASGVIYEIPCCNCKSVYIGETARHLKIRIQEHKKEVDNITSTMSKTRTGRKTSSSTLHKSAITDHSVQQNHVINWDEAKVVGKDSNWMPRVIKEAITIRKKKGVMNRDEGAFKLSHAYDTLLLSPGQRGAGLSQ